MMENKEYDEGFKVGKAEIQNKVEKLRIELTKVRNSYTQICERLWEITNTR